MMAPSSHAAQSEVPPDNSKDAEKLQFSTDRLHSGVGSARLL
ncbi:hypothetical protein AS9A_1779 [Hoyosella subflava DQS3-9A1]|uniref:Uncharacterized protein n=1 Tax=Hoyosella subflava (strain DSM 45089 / JCM 17490 / NBRC 109087 / DQS3-9A1) TaxID=443218 RepID=F6ELH8_HOYSD|nr:hypothetical protein AS9A_1779 [Hoyosella subflava DQS3-9A1]